ncbi:MAG: esterase-like activity of phytase family protein [Phycisphaerae bacterium]|nr:esterase-like activity of phytase family protein [Phycisphaerae bacterium]
MSNRSDGGRASTGLARVGGAAGYMAVGVMLSTTTGVAVAGESEQFFRRVSAFQVSDNSTPETTTAAEIVAAANNGTLLVYTDALSSRIGFVDITDPAAPIAKGAIVVGGDPTSVAVLGGYALAAVNTSKDFVNVSGQLLVIDVDTQLVVHEISLGGQPDAITISDDGRFAAIAIENERDEDLGSGEPPQLPPGYLVIVDLVGEPQEWTTRQVDLTGFPTLFPEDPEPEFVAINGNNIAVVTLQENNHFALVDLETGNVLGSFPAGTVDLTQIDVQNNGLIELTGASASVAREPDAVVWISDNAFATANEGDLFGGSRGFSIFSDDGSVLFDAGNTYEWAAVRVAHYPETRSGSKGTEPEGITYSEFETTDGTDRLLFVASERGSFIGVYRISAECTGDLSGDGAVDAVDLGLLLGAWGPAKLGLGDLDGSGSVDAADLAILIGGWGACDVTPELVQVLPAGARPEGLLAIPERGLFVAASELDNRAGKVRSTITIYERGSESTYPSFISADRADGTPIPWGALSGFIADPTDENRMWGVHDSAYRKTRIYSIELATTPATIAEELPLNDTNGVLLAALEALKAELPGTPNFNPANFVNADGTVNIDGEGLALASGGGFWMASEGAGNLVDGVSNPANQPFASPNLLVKVGLDGTILHAASLPIELTRNQLRFGFEGVAAVLENGVEILYVAFQRAWQAAGDPADLARIGRYDTATGAWTFAHYPLDAATSPNGGWVGVSEVTAISAGRFATIERDDQALGDARVKTVYEYSIDGVDFIAFGTGDLPVVRKTLRRDLIASGDFDPGVILEKIEGLVVLPSGRTLVITDNDGVGSTSGETRMMDLGILFGK